MGYLQLKCHSYCAIEAYAGDVLRLAPSIYFDQMAVGVSGYVNMPNVAGLLRVNSIAPNANLVSSTGLRYVKRGGWNVTWDIQVSKKWHYRNIEVNHLLLIRYC